MKRGFSLLPAIAFSITMILPSPGLSCTVAVVSGKATPDGRPLLWKNRDSDNKANKVVFFAREKYEFLGIVNSDDNEGKEVWAGVNSAGFCIMNAASYNVNEAAKKKDGDKRRMDEEGEFMKRALGACATVDEFQALLDATKDDRGVEANFGVIDAHGGAAFFETDNAGYVRFDADDPKVAPEGYIVRTNYSFSGTPSDGAGYIRFDRMSKLFHDAVGMNGISKDWILLSASRDMVNGLTGIDPLSQTPPAHAQDRRLYYMSDSITRNSACSTALFQGVRQDEDPVGTVMWTRLGHPLCSLAVPLWAAGGREMKLTSSEEEAPIDRFALYWLDRIFPLRGGSRDRYLDLAPLHNAADGGILRRLLAIESEILKTTDELLKGLEPTAANLAGVQQRIEELARTRLLEAFPEAAMQAGL
jgi:hypothetical protein